MSALRAPFASVLLGLVPLAACDRKPAPAPVVAAPSASASAARAPIASASASARPRGTGPLSPTEAKEYEAYLRGLRRGREAAGKGDHAAAIAALSEALTHWRDDARGYSERGYVYWLAKQPTEALADLERARQFGGDKVLRAQIEYNVGLAQKALDKSDEARAAFMRSNELNPTPAAARKVADLGPGCRAVVDSTSVEGKTYAGWSAARLAIKAAAEREVTYPDDMPTPADGSDGAAKVALLGAELAQKPGPWVAVVYNRWRFVSEGPAGDVIVHDLSLRMFSRCFEEPTSVALLEGPVPRIVETTELVWPTLSCNCGPGVEPKEGACPGGETPSCQSACFGVDEVSVREVVFDPSGRRRRLAITERNVPFEMHDRVVGSIKREVTVDVSAREVRLRGGGCDRTVARSAGGTVP
jgi:Tetratricopeptide repeat